MHGFVGKFIGAEFFIMGADDCVMGNLTQAQHNFKVRHLGDCTFEKGLAVLNLIACGFVLRRDAAHRIGDAAIDQLKAVIRLSAESAFCQAKF